MSIKTRLGKLEKVHKGGSGKITVTLIGDDPTDSNYLIIDPYGPNPQRISKAEHEAENRRLEAAGERVIVISPETIAQNAGYGGME
jgi:hypothetical protein